MQHLTVVILLQSFSKSVKQEICCSIVCIENQQNRYYTPGRKDGHSFRKNASMLLSRGQRSLVWSPADARHKFFQLVMMFLWLWIIIITRREFKQRIWLNRGLYCKQLSVLFTCLRLNRKKTFNVLERKISVSFSSL